MEIMGKRPLADHVNCSERPARESGPAYYSPIILRTSDESDLVFVDNESDVGPGLGFQKLRNCF